MVSVDPWGTGGECEPDVPQGVRQLPSPRCTRDGCHPDFVNLVMDSSVIGSVHKKLPQLREVTASAGKGIEIRCVRVFLIVSFITTQQNQTTCNMVVHTGLLGLRFTPSIE
jgi:hypothetical protein